MEQHAGWLGSSWAAARAGSRGFSWHGMADCGKCSVGSVCAPAGKLRPDWEQDTQHDCRLRWGPGVNR